MTFLLALVPSLTAGGLGPLQHGEVALGGSVGTRARVPGASPGLQPLEHLQMAALSSVSAGQLDVLRTAVIMCPLQDVGVARGSRAGLKSGQK